MFRSPRARAPATGMGGGDFGAASSAPPRRRGGGFNPGMVGGAAMETGIGTGMGMSPAGGRVPRIRTRDRIKRLLGFGRSRRGAARTVMY